LGVLGKALCLPFKLLIWLVTLPVRLALGPFKLAIVILLLALMLAGIQIVLFQIFFGD
jgi:hypothetical protein